MEDIIKRFSFLQDKFNTLNSLSWKKYVLLFNSPTAAENIAFMLRGEWDGCNGVTVDKCDEVAVNAAADLVGALWCYSGVSHAFLIPLSIDELQRRYAAGERNFVNANLRCSQLENLNLSGANLSWAKLKKANLSGTNLRGADLTAADLSEANLTGADLRGANLSLASLSGAFVNQAQLEGTCLRGAKMPPDLFTFSG